MEFIGIGALIIVLFLVLSFVLFRFIRQEMRFHQDQFLRLAGQQFATEQSKAASELEMRKQAVDATVQGLKQELEKYEKLLHEFEQDRAVKYGHLENELKNASQATVKLQETTGRLNNILGNVKLRGQWGERMAEDIIRYAGLVEGVNYIKQTKLESAATRPDYTFLLPDDHKVNMDAKFPMDNYLSMVNAESPDEQEFYQKEFLKNARERIKEIQNRDYINLSDNTLDFVILFIPNEQVYGFIQEKSPTLMDMALTQKVILCSPFTLYAMLSVIRQAHENFRYEKDLKKIIQLIEQFAKLYETFKVRFEEIGKTILKLEQQYQTVANTSFRQLDVKIRHIQEHKTGQPPSEDPLVIQQIKNSQVNAETV